MSCSARRSALPDLEISPRRHLIVARTRGRLDARRVRGRRMVGFVLHWSRSRGGDEVIGYSHMMAVARAYQNRGVGARLKWAQRERALGEGRHFIKWTWDPMQARNAHFNLNRLGVVVRSYAANYYGTDYSTTPRETGGERSASTATASSPNGNWTRRASKRSRAGEPPEPRARTRRLRRDSPGLGRTRPRGPARARAANSSASAPSFKAAFAAGLVCAGFERDDARPRYLSLQ